MSITKVWATCVKTGETSTEVVRYRGQWWNRVEAEIDMDKQRAKWIQPAYERFKKIFQ